MTETTKHPSFKNVFLYDPETGVFTGTYSAQLDPVENTPEYLQSNPPKYITPIHHTEVEPLAGVSANQVNVFANGEWSIQSDYRGQTIYHQTDDTSMVVGDIGPLPDGYALIPPPLTPEKIREQAQNSVNIIDVLIVALIDKGVITQKDIDLYTALQVDKHEAVLTAANKSTN